MLNAFMNNLRIVIVGGVAGGASAAARARRMNESAEIVLLEKDEHVSFANCGLPYYVGGEIAERDKLLLVSPQLFRDRFRIDVRTHNEAMRIDRTNKKLTVRDHEKGEDYELPYDRLILAPGATPIVPPMDGVDADNVFTLRNVADVDRIKSWCDHESPKNAVVVGAGYIGLEMVEQLVEAGLEVTLVELLKQVLPLLDPEMALPLQEQLEARGVDVHLGDKLTGMTTENGRATVAHLDTAGEIATDMVILGIGVKPMTKLATDAGLELGESGGIATNDHMQTSDPDIYAVGDMVETEHLVT
ncbi:MAG: NAD(P)/FAD-dependent oxidoreductase, partial [Phycisphaeraceae bacterium]